jgi:hypothetical protein
VIAKHVTDDAQLKKVQGQMLMYRGNTRKEAAREKIFGAYRIREVMERIEPSEKKDLLLWLTGANPQKPISLG